MGDKELDETDMDEFNSSKVDDKDMQYEGVSEKQLYNLVLFKSEYTGSACCFCFFFEVAKWVNWLLGQAGYYTDLKKMLQDWCLYPTADEGFSNSLIGS